VRRMLARAMNGRRVLVALAMCLAFGVASDRANAALFLQLSASEAAPGDTVIATTFGTGAIAVPLPPDSPPIRVFLVPAGEVSPTTADLGIVSPDDDRLVELGDLEVDAEGNGVLRFTVPAVPGGEYTTVTHCVPCAPYSAGRELLATGPTEPLVVADTGGNAVPALVVAIGLVGAALAMAWLRLGRQ
jgi:hypothetical protein